MKVICRSWTINVTRVHNFEVTPTHTLKLQVTSHNNIPWVACDCWIIKFHLPKNKINNATQSLCYWKFVRQKYRLMSSLRNCLLEHFIQRRTNEKFFDLILLDSQQQTEVCASVGGHCSNCERRYTPHGPAIKASHIT